MKPALKQAWVKALRSGEYEQGQGVLYNEGAWCCIGVLCNLPEVPGEWDGDEYVYNDDASKGGLPDGLNKAVGLPEGRESQLIKLNDIVRANFRNIADWIEKNL